MTDHVSLAARTPQPGPSAPGNERAAAYRSRSALALIVAGSAFLAAGAVGAGWGGISLHLHKASDYTAEALFVIGAVAMSAALAGLRRYAAGRTGSIGAVLAQAGLAAMAVGGVATIVTSDDRALGPVFIAGLLGSIVGVLLLAFALFRRGELARWTAPALALAWIAWPFATALLILPGLVLLAVAAAAARAQASPAAR